MAVQVINFIPDARVSRGDSADALLRDLDLPQRAEARRSRITGRAVFMTVVIALHVGVGVGLMNVQRVDRTPVEPEPIMATIYNASVQQETPPQFMPPPVSVAYALPVPQEISFESDAIAPEITTSTAITPSASQVVAPPMIEFVEYVRAPAPVYPIESNRRRERGTVMLRVLVDATGHPQEIQIERSSGYTRLDTAAREAVQNALFRPYEVNGTAQPAQVLIPIEFTRRAT
jgi:protein TonB